MVQNGGEKIDLVLMLKWCSWFIEGKVYIMNIVGIYKNLINQCN